ncbi:unnamed protein product, partial [Linum tenue]
WRLSRKPCQHQADLQTFLEASVDDSIYRNANLTPCPSSPGRSALLPPSSSINVLQENQSAPEHQCSQLGDPSFERSYIVGSPESIYFYGIVRLSQGNHEEMMALLASLEGSYDGRGWWGTVRYSRERVRSVIQHLGFLEEARVPPTTTKGNQPMERRFSYLLGHNYLMARHKLITVVPKDILIRILALIVGDSARDLVNTKLTCNPLLEASADDSVYRSANLTPFPVFSWSINPSATSFLDRCIASGNPEAFFRTGIKEYLSSNAIDSGMREAADSGHPESIYFYGIARLSRGEHGTGMALLTSLGGSFGGDRWMETVRYCRERVRSVIQHLCVRTTLVEPLEQNQGRRICSCDDSAVSGNVGRDEEWESKEDIELHFYATSGV